MSSPIPSPSLLEPVWPDQPGPYLFLVEVSGLKERRLMEQWIIDHRPTGTTDGQIQIAELPTTRRSAGRRRRDPALSAFLHGDEDSLAVPMRVAWLPRQRNGTRSVRWSDLLRFGDPRDPDPLRQYVIAYMSPDRVRIIVGEPERTSVLRTTWATTEAIREGRSFVDEVSHRAWLSLERAERMLRGTRYKVPKFPRETLIRSRAFQSGVATLARASGMSYRRMSARTRRYVGEIAATHSPYVIDLVTGGFRWLIGKAYVELNYDRDQLASLYQLAQRHPLVFLPTHKSHFDHQSLQFALYENGLPPNHTAGGINMNFFPVGPLLRRSGVFFIRREFKDNDPYKFVLRRYIDYLLRRRFPLEWYIEGGRSRTGKLLPPRFGLLVYVVESFLRGSSDDVVMIPVAIAYDQIQDVHSYAAEQAGGPKRPETFTWMLRSIRGLQRPYGGIHLRLGTPISLRDFLGEDITEIDAPDIDAPEVKHPAIPKLAFEIANRINAATPVTPISLVTLVMLNLARPATKEEISAAVEPYAREVEQRQLPTTVDSDLAARRVIDLALNELVAHQILEHDEASATFRIPPSSLLAAAYYRNTVIHHFLNGAIAELALADVLGTTGAGREEVLSTARSIRDLLLFDFFFPSREVFDSVVLEELTRRRHDAVALLDGGEIDELAATVDQQRRTAILLPFLDAYRVMADAIATNPDGTDAEFMADAMSLGRRYVLDQTIRSAESVSKVLFESALNAARHHDALGDDPEARRRFVGLLHRLAQLARPDRTEAKTVVGSD